jgi:hypothetical protein
LTIYLPPSSVSINVGNELPTNCFMKVFRIMVVTPAEFLRYNLDNRGD